MAQFQEDIRLVDLELFDAAFPIAPGEEDKARRRFMTLFVHEGKTRRGGSADVALATNALGERFALKRLHRQAPLEASGAAGVTEADGTAAAPSPMRRKELRHSMSGSDNLAGRSRNARNPAADGKGAPTSKSASTPDYVTQGHVAAFYEEYRVHLAVSNLRGFPGLYGFGLADGNPIILMEWVEGLTLRDAMRERKGESDAPLPLQTLSDLGTAVLALLARAQELENGFVHRDLSPRNIMLRTDRIPAAEQLERSDFDLCLIDFGSAIARSLPMTDPTFTMHAGVWRLGTPAYAPPEMLSADIALPAAMRQTSAIDIYALSSVLYELYAGAKPFLLGPTSPAPYRVKTETAPALLVPREPDGGALAEIIMAGLSIQQDDRPTIGEMTAALDNWKRLPSRTSAGLLRGTKPGDASFWQPDFARKAISRRKFIAGGIVALAALAAAGIVGSALLRQQPAPLDTGRYPRADAIYAGEPLFKALDGEHDGWLFATAAGDIACKPDSTREPGALREGLIALYDDASRRYGYISPDANGSAYAWAILPAFAQAGDFSEGLAAAQDLRTKLWGFVDGQGAWRIPPRFRAASPFSHGVAAVQESEGNLRWGAIDTEGAWVIDPRFTALGLRDADGHAVAQDAEADPSCAWGIVDAVGAWTGDVRFARLRRIVAGLAPAYNAKAGRWGFIDAHGSRAIAPAFLDARPFSEGLAAVQDVKTGLWRFIGADGTPYEGMEPRFWKLGELHDGLAPAQASDADDAIVFDESEPDVFAEGVGGRYGYVDAAGTWQMRRLTTLVDTAIGPAGL